MRLSLHRELPAGCALAWLHVAEPERINRWSRARVLSLAPGDGGHPGGVGALRRVDVPMLGGVRLREVIWASEPPHRLGYRVLPAFPLRRHTGTISIEPRGEHRSALHWEVEAELFP